MLWLLFRFSDEVFSFFLEYIRPNRDTNCQSYLRTSPHLWLFPPQGYARKTASSIHPLSILEQYPVKKTVSVQISQILELKTSRCIYRTPQNAREKGEVELGIWVNCRA